ncbi:MAG: hypothetical protein DYG91_05410 [Chloroflexi bacterium CFX7]|nr:hypothetical protein [Chloroflexi bacterium CFX7]RIL01866.1 MAG: hypothetical protein DCC78_09415 [bacterium]
MFRLRRSRRPLGLALVAGDRPDQGTTSREATMEMTTGMWVWMIAATVAWTGLLAALVFALNSRRDQSGAPPLEIAKRRYAAGEIDRDEFNRLTSDLRR